MSFYKVWRCLKLSTLLNLIKFACPSLSCMWDILPRPGIELRPLHQELRVLATWPPGRSRPSPFDLSWILPVGGSLLFPCSLPGSPVCKITQWFPNRSTLSSVGEPQGRMTPLPLSMASDTISVSAQLTLPASQVHSSAWASLHLLLHLFKC